MKGKDKIEILIIGASLLALPFLLISGVKNVKNKKVMPKQLEENIVGENKVFTEKKLAKDNQAKSTEIFEKIDKQTKNLVLKRDPFTFGTTESKDGNPVLCLRGIFWDETSPMAIINEYILKIGDKIKENTVVDIKQNKVILNNGNEDFELRLE